MKIASVFATTVLALGFSMSGVAIQSAYAAVDGATVTCADFTAMSPTDQQAGFDAVKAAMPAASLSTDNAVQTKSASGAGTMPPAPSVGLLVSACQADPSATVMAAVMKAMGSNMTTTMSK
jgi:hypothetical protein